MLVDAHYVALRALRKRSYTHSANLPARPSCCTAREPCATSTRAHVQHAAVTAGQLRRNRRPPGPRARPPPTPAETRAGLGSRGRGIRRCRASCRRSWTPWSPPPPASPRHVPVMLHRARNAHARAPARRYAPARACAATRKPAGQTQTLRLRSPPVDKRARDMRLDKHLAVALAAALLVGLLQHQRRVLLHLLRNSQSATTTSSTTSSPPRAPRASLLARRARVRLGRTDAEGDGGRRRGYALTCRRGRGCGRRRHHVNCIRGAAPSDSFQGLATLSAQAAPVTDIG